MTLPELAAHRKSMFFKYRDEFRSTFRVNLNAYWELLYGFDVVKFDELLQPPDGTSLYEHIRATYGDRAAELVSALVRDDGLGIASPAPEK